MFANEQLKIVSLKENQIATVDAAIGNMKSLEKINLERNQITCLPESLFQIPGLKQVLIESNPLNMDSLMVLKDKYPDVKIYY
jgi:Leucine-rich repeat (LRR) protein